MNMITQRVPQTEGDKGSKKWIQLLTEKRSAILLSHIHRHSQLGEIQAIDWRSPRRKDDFAEYRDDGFLDCLGLGDHREALASFWPKGGPQWDALGTDANKQHFFLVEAKANIPELVTECKAEDPSSIHQIKSSLHRTQAFLGSNPLITWSKGFYQYANRIAHLYFMREIARVDAFLVFIYFLNDNTHIPTTHDEWLGALTLQKKLMDLSRHKLQRFVLDVFIDVKEIKDNRTTGSSVP